VDLPDGILLDSARVKVELVGRGHEVMLGDERWVRGATTSPASWPHQPFSP